MAAKPTSEIILCSNFSEETDTVAAIEENIQALSFAEREKKESQKRAQRAVSTRRRIEDYLENRWMHDYHGIESKETETA